MTDSPAGRRRVLLAATEPLRALASAGGLAATLPLLALAPRGDRHPVLVLPGLMATDMSTTALRGWLRALGHPVVGWELGRNRGPTPEVVDALPGLVQRLADRHGTAVSIVGQSLGGIFARRLAARTPAQVRQVISLGSPFSSVVTAADDTPGSRVYRRFAPLHSSRRLSTADPARPLPVPSTSVYSRWDGVVDWRACLQRPGPRSENVGVHASHLGMGHDPAVLWVVADRLAQPADAWRPFHPPPGLARLFPGEPGDR
ncbi:triacylglycerol lipase [Blastococcus sp. TF02A-26]|uniref:esterase/lipase family protein n=1 Tax=Blastococcus sp. TF02A-26 TaxID=2250577 RepID=UPI000DE95495|nr:alpha/beta hydrolase [Blastococcus sp. TF02A-26]RBY85908.1 alpha/beta hydrolase [Blastococcus sp. TF02A-26]